MPSLLVAAGGGGDALAAITVHTLLHEQHRPAAVMTFAWERLRVDPLPGPRCITDFDGLTRFGSYNAVINTTSRARPPSGTTLPRLASELPVPLLLLDPAAGGTGLHLQVSEAVELLGADAVHVVDVGGDILAEGTEKDLRSPLADTLALCACLKLAVPVDVLVAGAGLDGELTPAYVRERVLALGGASLGRLTRAETVVAERTLDWHPSEATALLVSAAQGLRGRVEMRDQGTPIALDDTSSEVFQLSAEQVAAGSCLVEALCDTSSLSAAEEVARCVCGFSEIDYERDKAGRLWRTTPTETATTALLHQADAFTREAAARGIDYVTMRRLAEALPGASMDVQRLRNVLAEARPSQNVRPLWAVRQAP